MNIRKIASLSILIIMISASLFGIEMNNDSSGTSSKQHDMMKLMGKPFIDTLVEGLHLKVWLVTQKQHKSLMNRIKEKEIIHKSHEGVKMDKASKEAMMAGTHHFMLMVQDPVTGKEISNAATKILIDSPTKKDSFIDLKPMMGHYGESITLKQKGINEIIVSVNVDDYSRDLKFKYKVK